MTGSPHTDCAKPFISLRLKVRQPLNHLESNHCAKPQAHLLCFQIVVQNRWGVGSTAWRQAPLLVTTTLLPPALLHPFHEPLHLIPILPAQMKKFASGHPCRLRPHKRLKPPAKVRAIPGMQPVALCDDPVVPQHLEHSGDPPCSACALS